MSEFRREAAPNYSSLSGNGGGFEYRLRNAVDKRNTQGIAGLGDFRSGGTGGFNVDRKHLVYRDFYMSDEAFKLACDMDEKGIDVNPDVYAAWLSNCDVSDAGSMVVIRVPSIFYRENIIAKCGEWINRYYGKKRVKYEISTALRKRMMKEI